MGTIQTPTSSNIASFGWDGKLVVEFKSGDTWEYDAPKPVFEEMKKAKSAGGFLHARIKGKFAGRRRDVE